MKTESLESYLFRQTRLGKLGGLGHSPIRGAGIVVTTSNNSEKPMFTPIGAPRVATNPVISSVLRTPAVQLNSMVRGAGGARVVHDDAAGVYGVLKAVLQEGKVSIKTRV